MKEKAKHTAAAFAALALTILTSGSCMTYRGFPEELVNKPPAVNYDMLYYDIRPLQGTSIYSDEIVYIMRLIFMAQTPFKTTQRSRVMPLKGLYCVVETESRMPSMPAMFFGAISLASLTYLPAWSEIDGYYVTFRLYRDGQHLHDFEYDITRKIFLWAPVVPFLWVNAFTYSKKEAFEAITFKFFKDAAAHFQAADKNVPTPKAITPP